MMTEGPRATAMTAIRIHDDRQGSDPWSVLPDVIDPGLVPAVIAPEDCARLALERLDVPRPTDVLADDPWAEAGRKVIGVHLARMLGHVPGVIAGVDPEEVHAMRVAGRRIRAAWRVFGDGFEAEARRAYRRDLRLIGARLGAVRDLDVMLQILDAYLEKRPARQRGALGPMRSAWVEARSARHGELVELLRSTTFERFVTGYTALAIEHGRDARPARTHEPTSVRMRMPATVWAAYQDVWAFDRHLAGADMPTLHRLRITAKWLRYTVEFVRASFEPEATTLLRRVVALQDRLGDIHDLHGAATLAAEHLERTAGIGRAERTAVARFERQMDARTARLGRDLGPTWRRLSGPGYRRVLGEAISRL